MTDDLPQVPGAGPNPTNPPDTPAEAGADGPATPPTTPTNPLGTTTPGGDQEKVPWSWAVNNWKTLAALAVTILAVVLIIFAAVRLLGFPNVAAPSADSTVAQVNSSVGAHLVEWGLVLTIVSFIPVLLLSLLAGFKIEERAKEREGEEGFTGVELVREIIAGVPNLLKIPGGFGVVLILLGVLLMSATTLANDESAGGSPTPSAEITEPSVTASPSPETE